MKQVPWGQCEQKWGGEAEEDICPHSDRAELARGHPGSLSVAKCWFKFLFAPNYTEMNNWTLQIPVFSLSF